MSEYKVFISHKSTDKNGRETEDIALASELAAALEASGIKTFYSELSLRNKGVDQFKKEIDSALDQADVLIVVGSCIEHITSDWVRYEWDGFFTDILSGRKKGRVFSYVWGIELNDLPRSLRQLQVFKRDEIEIKDVVEYVSNALNELKTSSQATLPSQTTSSIAPSEPSSGHQDVKTVITKRKRVKSTYSYSDEGEQKRLITQMDLVRENDIAILNREIKNFNSRKKINVLDIGCSSGKLTFDIFSNISNRISNVIGFDKNSNCIAEASSYQAKNHSQFHFYCADVEADEFDIQIKKIMEQYSITGFDIIFSALTIHHLSAPQKVLKKLRRYLSSQGFLYVRTCDDGEIFGFPDDDKLIRNVLDATDSVKGSSDRYHGRRLYAQLVKAGYDDIRFDNYYVTTAGMSADERHDLFYTIFQWRKNRYKTQLDSSPNNKQYLKSYIDYCNTMDEIEERFFDPLFYFCVPGPIAIARKKQ